jgi:hypothetical protein
LEDSKEAYDNDGTTSWEELKPYIDEMKHNIADILLPKPQTGTIEQTQSISPEQIQEDRDNAILAEVASMMREVFGIY